VKRRRRKKKKAKVAHPFGGEERKSGSVVTNTIVRREEKGERKRQARGKLLLPSLCAQRKKRGEPWPLPTIRRSFKKKKERITSYILPPYIGEEKGKRSVVADLNIFFVPMKTREKGKKRRSQAPTQSSLIRNEGAKEREKTGPSIPLSSSRGRRKEERRKDGRSIVTTRGGKRQ